MPNLQVSSAHQIRVVYAIPSDGVDNFAQDASPIATDIAAMDEWWRGQDPTRTPRFDLYPFPGCTTTFGDLDLAFVRTPSPGANYVNPYGVNLTALAVDIGASTSQAVKTLVYYDGPVVDPNVCGTSFTNEMSGGPSGIVVRLSPVGLLPRPRAGRRARAGHDPRADPQPRRRPGRRSERLPATRRRPRLRHLDRHHVPVHVRRGDARHRCARRQPRRLLRAQRRDGGTCRTRRGSCTCRSSRSRPPRRAPGRSPVCRASPPARPRARPRSTTVSP